jgi:hypothetical protein
MAQAQDVIDYALKMLAQTQASIVAGFPSGTGEADGYAISPTTQMLSWATEAQNRIARLCMPIQDVAAVQPAAAGAPILAAYTQIVAPSGRTMHQASQIMIAGRQLQAANMGYLSGGYWYPPDLYGNPTAWANNNSGVALSAYTTQPIFTVLGYFLAVPLTALDQDLDPFIDDYAQIAMWSYLAWRIAVSNQDNTVLAERAGSCLQEFANTVREIYTRLISNDNTLSAYFPPQAIDAQVQAMKQLIPKT